MDDETKSWMREMTDLAVRGTGEVGMYDEAIVESRPEWALPNRLLLGKVRTQSNARAFHWFICGEIPLDYLPGDVATTPREALRHFSMKWQLDAERSDDDTRSQELVENAEAVYDLADDERFWQT